MRCPPGVSISAMNRVLIYPATSIVSSNGVSVDIGYSAGRDEGM